MRRPALFTAILFALGVLTAYFTDPPVGYLLLSIVFLLMLGVLSLLLRRSEGFLMQMVFCVLIWTTGVLRYEQSTSLGLQRLPVNHIHHFPAFGEKVQLTGRIVDEPEALGGKRRRMTVEAERVAWGDAEAVVCGKVRITVKEGGGGLDFGDRIQVKGRLRRPSPARNPGALDYRTYLRRRGIFGLLSVYRARDIRRLDKNRRSGFMARVILPIRASIRRTVDRNLSGAPAGLLKGLLLGEKRALPEDVRKAFATVGISHVLAVSGLHVGLIAGVLFFAFRLLSVPRVGATIATLSMLFLYVFVVDLRPSAVRAVIMTAVLLIGFVIERDVDLLNSLGVAGLTILAVWPQSLFDIGFQLSFGATCSIALFYRPIVRMAGRIKRTPIRYAVGLLAVSVAAQIGTAPLILRYFHRLSLIAPLANLVVVPVVGGIVALGLLSSFFGFRLIPVATAWNAVNYALLTGLIHVVRWLAAIPYASVSVRPPSVLFFGIYFGGVALLFLSIRRSWARKGLLFAALLVANLYVWKGLIYRERDLEITFLDVGQGDAIFLQFPNGQTMLVDGGPRTHFFDAGTWIVLPFLRYKGVHTIDVLVPTHSDNDHIGGLISVAEHMRVKHVLTTGQEAENWTDDRFWELMEEHGVTRHVVSAGDSLLGLGGVGMVVLHPTPAFVSNAEPPPSGMNNTSIVLRVTYGGASVLLTGDAEIEAEASLLWWCKRLNAVVLKVGHHGARTSSGERFVEAVHPQIAVISVGERNPFGHPSPEVLERLQQVGACIYRTDRQGAVTLRIAPKRFKVQTMINGGE